MGNWKHNQPQSFLVSRLTMFSHSPSILHERGFTDGKTYPLKKNASFIDSLASGWSDHYGNGTVGHTSTAGEFLTGTGGIKMTLSTSSTGMKKNVGSSLDWSGMFFKLRVMCADWTKVQSFKMRPMMTNSLSGAYFDVELSTYLTVAANHNNQWLEIIVPLTAFTVGGGVPDWTDVNYLMLMGNAVSGQSPVVYFDEVQLITNAASAPIVSITFDDGHDSNATLARQVLDIYGYNATLFLAPELVGTANYLTQAQVDSLADSDWEIAGHADTNLTTLTGQALESFVRSKKLYLQERGYLGSDLFAYPNGAWNDEVLNVIDKYFKYARTIINWQNPIGYTEPLTIYAKIVNASISAATVTGWIDDAITNNYWLVLVFHRIKSSGATGTEYNQADLDTIVDYLATNSVETIPFGQAIAKQSLLL